MILTWHFVQHEHLRVHIFKNMIDFIEEANLRKASVLKGGADTEVCNFLVRKLGSSYSLIL